MSSIQCSHWYIFNLGFLMLWNYKPSFLSLNSLCSLHLLLVHYLSRDMLLLKRRASVLPHLLKENIMCRLEESLSDRVRRSQSSQTIISLWFEKEHSSYSGLESCLRVCDTNNFDLLKKSQTLYIIHLENHIVKDSNKSKNPHCKWDSG